LKLFDSKNFRALLSTLLRMKLPRSGEKCPAVKSLPYIALKVSDLKNAQRIYGPIENGTTSFWGKNDSGQSLTIQGFEGL
jgi:hypothetical protein